MFGYIKTDTPELKVKHWEAYKGVYCSLCNTLGKRYGVLSRLFLSYDCTFLALFLLSLENECTGFEKMHCPFNPAKKCNRIKGNSKNLDFCADICVLLTYYKIKDNITDGNFSKSMFFKLLKLIIYPIYKKGAKLNPSADKIIGDYISAQQKCENEKCTDIDIAAEPTGEMLSSLLMLKLSLYQKKDNISRFAYLLGRWIYLIDAFDDIEKDKKNDNYNVFVLSQATDREKIKGDLLMTAGEIYNELKQLDYYKFGEIIENIIKDGLYKQTINIYCGGNKNDGPL